MDFLLAQLGGGGDIYSWIIWIAFFMIFFLFYPRLMLSQIMWKLEKVVAELENMAAQGKSIVTKEISNKPDKKLRNSINRFFEFFVISPVSLDPMGIVKKLDHIIKAQNERFDYFVNQISPDMDPEKKANDPRPIVVTEATGSFNMIGCNKVCCS